MFFAFIVTLLVVALPALSAAAVDGPPIPTDSGVELRLAWVSATVGVVHMLVAYLKSDRFPVDIPARYRTLLAFLLAQLSGALQMVVMGVPWQAAVLDALVAGMGAVSLQEAVVEGVRKGKDWFPPMRDRDDGP